MAVLTVTAGLLFVLSFDIGAFAKGLTERNLRFVELDLNFVAVLQLACDNLMEGSTLVDLSSQSVKVKDFYDTPLHMVATAAEIAKING